MRGAWLVGSILIAMLPAGLVLAQAAPAPQSQSEPLPANPVPSSPFRTNQELVHLKPSSPDSDADATPEQRCEQAEEQSKKGVAAEMGTVEFKMYLSQVSKITQANWKPLMPKEVDKPFYKTGDVTVCFAILPNGRVEPKSMVLRERSGDVALDRAAWGAIETSVYPRLPEEYKGPRVVLKFCFQYNKDRRPNPVKNMAKPPNPFGPVAVTVGYTSKL